jgi:hypothetical protein
MVNAEQKEPTLEERLVEALEHNNRLLRRLNHNVGDWKWLLFRSILMGLGGVIGATIVVSLLVSILQPFTAFEGLGPAIDRLSQELSRE